MKFKTSFFLLVLLLTGSVAYAQKNEDQVVHDIYQNALTTPYAYNTLNDLCTQAPGRLVGSEASERAIKLLQQKISDLHPDTCYRQNYTTTSWQCNEPTQAILYYLGRKEVLKTVNLGLSVSTPKAGIKASVVEVHSMKELDSLGTREIKGKIVFFNRPMDNSLLNTFDAYGGAIDQRSSGAAMAAKYGAVGVIIRSLATEHDNFPHTGVSHYRNGITPIPNLAISTNDADKLSAANTEYPGVKVWIKSNTQTLDTVHTANLIAEIKGSVHPEKVILIGAHMDSWFNTPGAHDDGAGCAQMIDVIRIFKDLNLKPQNTIRLVLFMDEEMLQSGSKVYAEFAEKEQKQHIACFESDAGGLLPLGFEIDASDVAIKAIQHQSAKLADYGVYQTIKGFGGVDVNPLKKFGFPLIGLLTNSQRYFEYHHSANDTVDQVSRREMQLGTASIASLVYLIDKNGL